MSTLGGDCKGGLIDAFTEISQVIPQLIPYMPEYGKPLGFRADCCGRILKIAVKLLPRAQEDWARFASIVANRDQIVELLPLKFIDVFGAVPGNINPQLVHDGYRFRAHETWLRSGAYDFEPLAGIPPQQSFGHLTAR